MKIIVSGSIAFDYLMSFPGQFSDHFLPDKLESISVSFLVDSMRQQHGGCAGNISYSLALLGENPSLVGTVGKDFEGYRKVLDAAGVDTSTVRVMDDVYTASFFVNTDQRGNQIASFYTGAMQFARDLSLKDVVQNKDAIVIISPNDPEAMARNARECRELGVRFIYDPSQQIARLDGDALKAGAEGASILILNDYELEMFKKKTGMDDADLLRLAETVIVTLGEKGTEIRKQDGVIHIPVAPPKQILDPTGVGDAFRSGLMKGLVHGLSWEAAGRMGSLAATYVLETDGGPQSHAYDLDGFVQRYNEVFRGSDEVQGLLSK